MKSSLYKWFILNILNPIKGYLNSANQNPVDEHYPYYLSEYFARSYRASQINIRLYRRVLFFLILDYIVFFL